MRQSPFGGGYGQVYARQENDVITHRYWWGGLSLGRDTLNNSGIVADNTIMMHLWRRQIIGHAVVAHVNVLQVLRLGSYGKILDRVGSIHPVLVRSMTTSGVR